MAALAVFVFISAGLFGPAPRTMVHAVPEAPLLKRVDALRLALPCARPARLDLFVGADGPVKLRVGEAEIQGVRLRDGWTGFHLTGVGWASPARFGEPALIGFDESRPTHRVLCAGAVERSALTRSTSLRFARNHPLGPVAPAVAAGVFSVALAAACALGRISARRRCENRMDP